MKKRKFFMALLVVVIALSTVIGFTACNDDEFVRVSDGGKVLNIRCWNDEFQNRFRAYYPDYIKTNSDGQDILQDGTVVNWIIVANEGNAYQDALDAALKAQKDAKKDERVDLFLVEADYALKYVDSDYTLDVKKELGLTDEDLSQQYQYTKDIVTDSDGVMKGTSWQATPGLYAYRRDIALEVLGTDDPDEVQALISDWEKFETVAAQMKAKDYYMVSDYEAMYRPYSNNFANPWVNENNQIVIDPQITKWIAQTKDFADKGYIEGTKLWDTAWAAGQGPNGKVFGYFYSTWGINFTLLGNSLEVAVKNGGKLEVGNGNYGKWAVCYGPQSFYWGGTWLCGAAGTDNASLVKDIMWNLTCSKTIMKNITTIEQDYTNNMAAMQEIANSDFESEFLGGQNHIKLFVEAAKKIDMSNITYYDQGLNENLQTAMRDYFKGTIKEGGGITTQDDAWSTFYSLIKTLYPNLKKA
jgi:hypothetical protein